MFLKCVFVLFFIHFALGDVRGQNTEKFFRRDYTFLPSTNSFYKFQTLHKTWAEAKVICDREGASFFYPGDEDEAAAVIELWNKTQPHSPYIFIGVSDWVAKEAYDTVDGKPISDVYNNWGYGEPNNAGGIEGCVVLRKDGTLNDDNCSKKFPFICSKTLGTLQWNEKCDMPDQSYKFDATLNRCYKFHLDPQSWPEAYRICYAEQSYLAVINSDAEAAHLVNITTNAPKEKVKEAYVSGAVHLGFKYMDGWMTTKGVPLYESGYDSWGHGQPDGGSNETCGSMFYNGHLNDIGCSQKMFFICEHEVALRTEDIAFRFNIY